MPGVIWYFDFISPYAYFGLHTLRRLPAGTDLNLRPVLLAGLLKHWGQKGPAEIAPKRVWTYRSCIWLATQHQVPFRLPAAHPFNPLPYLRLAIAAGNTIEAIQAIFRALWTTGSDPADPQLISGLAETLRVPLEHLGDASIKDRLRENTEQAARDGVFGVPSLVINKQVFWGSDAVDFAAAYLHDPAILATDEIRRADALPVGASRAGSS
ncbi:MAG: 2-hydroxychromene-2-carboxylate isomerase [Steroidobacterales bacterium]